MNASYFSLITQKQRFMIFPRRIHVGSNERWREPQLSFHTSIVSSKAIKKKEKRKNSSFKLFHAIKVSIMHHIQVFVSTQDRFRPDEYKTALIINFHLSHWHKSKFKKKEESTFCPGKTFSPPVMWGSPPCWQQWSSPSSKLCGAFDVHSWVRIRILVINGGKSTRCRPANR